MHSMSLMVVMEIQVGGELAGSERSARMRRCLLSDRDVCEVAILYVLRVLRVFLCVSIQSLFILTLICDSMTLTGGVVGCYSCTRAFWGVGALTFLQRAMGRIWTHLAANRHRTQSWPDRFNDKLPIAASSYTGPESKLEALQDEMHLQHELLKMCTSSFDETRGEQAQLLRACDKLRKQVASLEEARQAAAEREHKWERQVKRLRQQLDLAEKMRWWDQAEYSGDVTCPAARRRDEGCTVLRDRTASFEPEIQDCLGGQVRSRISMTDEVRAKMGWWDKCCARASA